MTQQQSVDIARQLVMALLAQDVADAVLSPGSRSGPLALALHAADEQGLLRLHVRVDEREAGFLALGLAKASGRVVPVVTTSGTAVANLHPAMLEALHSQVPLLAITADRPARLRGTGANQTTVQPGIFPGVEFADRVSAMAGAVRLGGPVHLNLEFDEPLIEPVRWDFPQKAWTMTPQQTHLSHEVSTKLRTIVIAGDDADPTIAGVARAAGWPIIAEPSSGLRAAATAIACGQIVADGPLADRIEQIVCTGHPTLSRPVLKLLSRTDIEIIHVGTPGTFPAAAGANVQFVSAVRASGRGDDTWLRSWLEIGDRTAAALQPAEPLEVARTVWEAAATGLLFVGSSNSIRDLNLVAPVREAGPRVLANRGLAGIDGTVSSAVGAALTTWGRSFALLGDLTFLHGANALLIGPAEPRPDLTIVVLNDDGGGIFHTLEQGAPEYGHAFERVFGTPTGTSIKSLCEAHGVLHREVEVTELAQALEKSPSQIEVVEVKVSRAGRRSLQSVVSGLGGV